MKYFIYILFCFSTSSSFSQAINNNGGVVNILSGTVVNAASVANTSGTFSNAGTLTLTSNYSNAGAGNGNGTYNIAGNWSNSGTFTSGTSTVNFNGAGAQNIGATSFYNLVAAGGGIKTASGAIAINGVLNINSGVTLDMGTNALSGAITSALGTGNFKTQNTSSNPIPAGISWAGPVYYNSSSAQNIVQANYTNLDGTGGNRTLSSSTTGIAGTFTVGSGTYITTGSTIDFNGASAQNIPAFSFYNITVSGGNTKTVNGSVKVSRTLSLSANTTLALGSNNITLLSDTNYTARVAAIPVSAAITYGTGKFIAQRYIQGRRKYRLMTSPVTTAIGTLITGQEALSIWGNWQNQADNATANSGTIITGGTTTDGFDQQTTNASLYTYDDVNHKYLGYTSAKGKNTKYTPLKAGIAYYMFVYGDRLNAVSTNTPNYTVLSAAGTILTGDQNYNTSSSIPLTNTVGNYTMLGNPFASAIDWATITKTNLYNTFWGWDPNLSSTGGYVTVSTAGSVTLISPYTGTTGLNQYIQSGQGFFVRTSATSPVLVIKESDKVSNNNTIAFRTTTNSLPLIAVNLFDNSTKTFEDGALIAFDNNFSNDVGKEDAAKIFGSAEGLSVGVGSELLSIDARQMPQNTDTIFLNASRLTKPEYVMQIFSNGMDNSNLQPYLQDSYLKTIQALSLTDTNRIVFKVSSDAASSDAGRFKIVFQKSNTSIISNAVKSQLIIFPNPIKDQQINFKLNDLEQGAYSVTLNNSFGQQILKSAIDHPGGNLTQTIYVEKKLSAGIYYLNITNKNNHYTQRLLIE